MLFCSQLENKISSTVQSMLPSDQRRREVTSGSDQESDAQTAGEASFHPEEDGEEVSTS